jgi:hypothetical protein
VERHHAAPRDTRDSLGAAHLCTCVALAGEPEHHDDRATQERLEDLDESRAHSRRPDASAHAAYTGS